jgi:uncharacterized membrane protein
MNRDTRERKGSIHRFAASIEIDADIRETFEYWTHLEDLPGMMGSLRRACRIDDRRILWDTDICGHQLVWESEIIEVVPEQRVRWRSRRGMRSLGKASFEELADGRTLLSLEIRYEPQHPLGRLGARLGMVDHRLRRDLAQFKRAVEEAQTDLEKLPA